MSSDPLLFTDPFGLDITIHVWSNLKGTFIPHMGIGVNTEHTVGFYPAHRYPSMLWGTPGSVHSDDADGEPDFIYHITTTSEQDRLIQEYIDAHVKDPGDYELFTRNCTQFVTDALRHGGVEAPFRTYSPAVNASGEEFFRHLQNLLDRLVPKNKEGL